MGWLRRLAGISRLTEEEKWWHQTRIKPNGYTSTKDTEKQSTVVQSCEADEQLKITSKSTGNIDIGTRSRCRQNKRWINNVIEDLQQRGSDMRQAAERVKDRKHWKNYPCSSIVGNLRVKTDGSEKKKILTSGGLFEQE